MTLYPASAGRSTTTSDPYDLQRFVHAQEGSYEKALSEIKSGQKQSHWMWYVFPQFAGLGWSATSRRYAIKSLAEARAYLAHPLLGPRLAEARAYLAHPLLGPRLVECADALLSLQDLSANDVFGYPDDLKLRSSATLFAQVSSSDSVFHRILDKYFEGQPDEATLRLIEA